jgi:hypothetical protein
MTIVFQRSNNIQWETGKINPKADDSTEKSTVSDSALLPLVYESDIELYYIKTSCNDASDLWLLNLSVSLSLVQVSVQRHTE